MTNGIETDTMVGGRYRVIRLLGEGGMGVVYEAEHVELQRSVALKVLLPSRTQNERVLARFKQEARVAASIGHPGIVKVFDLGECEDQGQIFIAMELLEGEEFAERIRREVKLSVDFALRVCIELADAVAAAHEHGIVHRDLKPQNVFLVNEGRRQDVVKVLDFGLAKLIEGEGSDTTLTRSGELFGTPLYMSPEQLQNAKKIDGRTDIYAIGVILYQALTGEPPYQAENLTELIFKVATESPTPIELLRPDLPPQLVEVVERATAKELTQRYQTVVELYGALKACLDTGEIETIPPAVDRAILKTHEQGTGRLSDFISWSGQKHPRRLAPALIGLVSLLILMAFGTVLMVFLLSQREGESEGDEQSVSVIVPPSSTEAVTRDAGEEPNAQPPEAKADTSGIARLSRHTVHFETTPAGAQISLDGEPLCKTPCSAELEDRDALVSTSLKGYRSASQKLRSPLPSVVKLRLAKASRPGPSTKMSTRSPTKSKTQGGPPPLLPR